MCSSQRSLGLTINDFKLQARLSLDAPHEIIAIFSGSAGFGRNQPCPVNTTLGHLIATDF